MSDSLASYLHDHLAGSNFAVELLSMLRDQHTGEPLGQFAANLLAEVQQDRQVLQQIIDDVRAGSSPLKEAAGWVAEKVSLLKLSRASSGDAGTFEALEALALGVRGKLALWRALSVTAPADQRLQAQDFQALSARAQDQFNRIEARRLEFAVKALTAVPR